MEDITKQSEKFNSVLKEKRMNKNYIKDFSNKEESNNEESIEKAMRIYDKFMDVIAEENVTVKDVYLICSGIAESIYYYSLFGEE